MPGITRVHALIAFFVAAILWGVKLQGADLEAPGIDAQRNRLYIGTGENYSCPATDASDAIMALDLDTGEPVWSFQALENDVYNASCLSYLGYSDGANGQLIWEFDSKGPFETINGVAAHGGSLDNAGPAVVNGYLVLQSGYRYINQISGNLLLVFR
jgi:outer membrane protein assembly factor BamB